MILILALFILLSTMKFPQFFLTLFFFFFSSRVTLRIFVKLLLDFIFEFRINQKIANQIFNSTLALNKFITGFVPIKNSPLTISYIFENNSHLTMY